VGYFFQILMALSENLNFTNFLIVAYKRITDKRLIEEANLSILNFHMGARVRNQYQSNNVINIHAFQELIIVVNVLMKIFIVFEIKWSIFLLLCLISSLTYYLSPLNSFFSKLKFSFSEKATKN
jgi:hypothetical protein